MDLREYKPLKRVESRILRTHDEPGIHNLHNTNVRKIIPMIPPACLSLIHI